MRQFCESCIGLFSLMVFLFLLWAVTPAEVNPIDQFLFGPIGQMFRSF